MSQLQTQGIEYCESTLALQKSIEESFLVLGERLYRIKQDELYRGRWETFGEFCQEAKITEATASKLITVYRVYVHQYGLEKDRLIEAGWNALYEGVPLIANGSDAKDFVEKATTLRREDLREEIREAKAGKHEHDWETFTMRRCRTCNKHERI